MPVPRDNNVNLFEDKRGEYEYGWVQFPEDTTYNEKKIEIRRKAGSGIDDNWEFLWNGEWWDIDKTERVYPTTEDMPDELLCLCFALVDIVELEMNVADGFKTHNARQENKQTGKALLSFIGKGV